MFRTIATAAVIAAILPAAAMAASWTTGGVNFRNGPSTAYDVIGYLPKCASVETYGWQNGWVEIAWEGQRGWVSGKYIADSNAHCGYGQKSSGYSSDY